MLKGKEYSNGIRIHFYIAEAVSRKKFEAFEEWLRNNYKCSGYYGDLERAESEDFRSSRSPETFKEAMSK